MKQSEAWIEELDCCHGVGIVPCDKVAQFKVMIDKEGTRSAGKFCKRHAEATIKALKANGVK